MFGIGFPEMIVILAIALIVVGPDKLPDLARSLAKGVVELKKTMNQLKYSITEATDAPDPVKDDTHQTDEDIRKKLIDENFQAWRPDVAYRPPEAAAGEVIDIPAQGQADEKTASEPAAAPAAEETVPDDSQKAAVAAATAAKSARERGIFPSVNPPVQGKSASDKASETDIS